MLPRRRLYGWVMLFAAAGFGRRAWATQYFTVEQVQRQLFPEADRAPMNSPYGASKHVARWRAGW